MDLLDLLLSLFPGLAWLAPYALALSGLAAWTVATFPAPQTGVLVPMWAVLNRLGANVRHARNRECASDPQGSDPLTKPPDAGG